jgi:HipA-like protein
VAKNSPCGWTERAGTIARARSSGIEFAYTPEWQDRPSATALSLALPLAADWFDPAVVENWFAGLVPDDPSVRQAWARRFGVPDRVFDLLGAVGADLP